MWWERVMEVLIESERDALEHLLDMKYRSKAHKPVYNTYTGEEAVLGATAKSTPTAWAGLATSTPATCGKHRRISREMQKTRMICSPIPFLKQARSHIIHRPPLSIGGLQMQAAGHQPAATEPSIILET